MNTPPTALEILTTPNEHIKTVYRSGLWRATVTSVDDIESRGRIQVRVTQLHLATLPQGAGVPVEGIPDELCPWAEPCFPFGGSANAGSIMLPEVGATVWVAFEMGFIGKPVWLGGWYGTLEPPAEFLANPAEVRMIRTPWGHTLLFDDTSGSWRILIESGGVNSIELKDSASGGIISAVTMDGDRSLVLDDVASSVILQDTPTCKITMDATQLLVQAAAGSSISIDLATGNVTVLTAGTISLGTGAAKGVALDSLLTILNNFIGIFNAHTHAYNPGPGGPTPTAGPVAPGVPGVSGTDTSLTVFAKV